MQCCNVNELDIQEVLSGILKEYGGRISASWNGSATEMYDILRGLGRQVTLARVRDAARMAGVYRAVL